MSEVVERVIEAWEMIEEWFAKNKPTYKLAPGASAADIEKLETRIGLPLPEELKASLMRHDGVDELHWPKGELCSVEGILRDWEMRAEIFDAAEDGDAEGGMFKAGWWRNSWIPIDADGAGNGACIDLEPGTKGKKGQIIDFDHETGPNGPQYEDLGDYMEACVDDLRG